MSVLIVVIIGEGAQLRRVLLVFEQASFSILSHSCPLESLAGVRESVPPGRRRVVKMVLQSGESVFGCDVSLCLHLIFLSVLPSNRLSAAGSALEQM